MKKNEWPTIDSAVMLAINFMMVRLRAAVAFSEDVSSALVAKIAAGVAWVPDDVGDLQTPDVEHRSEFNPDDNRDDMQPLRVLVQMAQVSVPKMPYVTVWGGGSCLTTPNLSAVHAFGNLQMKFIKLFTLCWRVCPAMQCRLGEEGSYPARPGQKY